MFSDEYAAKYVTPHDTCCWMLTCWWTHRITVDLWISQLYDICQSKQLVGEIIGNIIIVHDKSQTLNRKQKENYMNFLLRRDSKTMNQTKEKTCTKVVHSLTIHPSKCTALRMMWCVVVYHNLCLRAKMLWWWTSPGRSEALKWWCIWWM